MSALHKQPDTVMLQPLILTMASILGAFLPTYVALDVKKQSNPSHVGNLNKKLHRRDLQGSNCLLFEMVDCVSKTQSWYAEVWTWAGCIPSETDYPAAIYTVSDSAYWWEGTTTYWKYESNTTNYWATIYSGAFISSSESCGLMNTGDPVYADHHAPRCVGISGCNCEVAYFANVTSKLQAPVAMPDSTNVTSNPQAPVAVPSSSSVKYGCGLFQVVIIAIAVGSVVQCLALLV